MSKLNEDIIIRYLENRCSEEDFVLINEWMKESDENAGELFRMEEIYQLGKFPFEEENLVVRAERRLGRRLKRENQKKQEVCLLFLCDTHAWAALLDCFQPQTEHV